MRTAKPWLLSLVCAAACGKQNAPAPVTGTPPTAAAPKPAPAPLTLDESKLPTPNRFTAADLDPAKKPCVDFVGHVNSKYLAANPNQRAFAANDKSWWLKDLRSDPRYQALVKPPN